MELWNLYDKQRNITDIIWERDKEIPKGYYHLVVRVWIKNKNNEYLVSKRDEYRKSFPLFYECPGGSVLRGENSIEGAIREVKEEIGIDLKEINGKKINTLISEEYHVIEDTWLFNYDGDIDTSQATEKEICDVRWMTVKEIEQLDSDGKFIPGVVEILKKVIKNEL